MSAASRALVPLDRDTIESTLLAGAAPRRDSLALGLALGIAVALHAGILLLVELPDRALSLAPADPGPAPPLIFNTPLPPPSIEPLPPAPPVENVRRKPVPDSNPFDPEPLVAERHPPVPDELPAIAPADYDFIPLAPPPPDGPRRPGADGVTHPVLLQRVEPDYPELARRAQLAGDVVLLAVVFADGSVGELQVLRCTRPGIGFEEAAIDAVGRWRYEPATQRGRPVDIFLTVHVRFVLH